MIAATDPLARMEEFRDAIVAAGVRCVLDPRDVNPPAVLILPPATLSYRFNRGVIAADWTARLYMPDAGVLNAVREGLPILDAVYGAFADLGIPLMTAERAEYPLADGGTVPGFTLTWNTSR